jgi:hypothetical protein
MIDQHATLVWKSASTSYEGQFRKRVPPATLSPSLKMRSLSNKLQRDDGGGCMCYKVCRVVQAATEGQQVERFYTKKAKKGAVQTKFTDTYPARRHNASMLTRSPRVTLSFSCGNGARPHTGRDTVAVAPPAC